ncbi:formin-like protein 5 [Drosophila eugracilis]|uniref:formin-like protein 5 n=1 Tax=Drosophila eugracilis TaxID=29029 RepID=UPI0007E712CE|nr:formin-like protein 5 [Drosophila eugracilis]
MLSHSRLLLLTALLGVFLGHISADPESQNTQLDDTVTREKRGTVTLDFGLLLRNLLLKSAQLSSAKANLVRTTRRPPTTTTTTPAPPPPPPPRIRKPFWHPFFSSGFLPLDYSDLADPPAPRPTAPPPPAAQPTRRVRPRPRPTPPPPPPPPNYDYDYDYDAPAPPPAPTEAPPPPPPAAPPRPRPRPRPRPPQQQPDPQQRQLGGRLIYQYAQPTDTFFRSRAEAEAADDPDSGDDSVAVSDTDLGANADAADGAQPNTPTASTAPRFLVNYESDSDYGSPPSGQQDPPTAPGIPASPQGYFSNFDFGSITRFPTPNHQQYFYN